MHSFEMAIIYIFPTHHIKWSEIDLSKIQIAVFSKVLIESVKGWLIKSKVGGSYLQYGPHSYPPNESFYILK